MSESGLPGYLRYMGKRLELTKAELHQLEVSERKQARAAWKLKYGGKIPFKKQKGEHWKRKTNDTFYREVPGLEFPYQLRTNAAAGWIVLKWRTLEDVFFDKEFASIIEDVRWKNKGKWFYISDGLIDSIIQFGKKRVMAWENFEK